MNENVARHLRHAIELHAMWCRANGLPMPTVLAQFGDALVASGGQDRPLIDPAAETGDGGLMLTLSYREAGDRLGVSDRTVRRLVARGELPAVEVGGTRRIRTEDLRSYVAGLAQIRRVTAPDEAEIIR